jgi:hypothetical protein
LQALDSITHLFESRTVQLFFALTLFTWGTTNKLKASKSIIHDPAWHKEMIIVAKYDIAKLWSATHKGRGKAGHGLKPSLPPSDRPAASIPLCLKDTRNPTGRILVWGISDISDRFDTDRCRCQREEKNLLRTRFSGTAVSLYYEADVSISFVHVCIDCTNLYVD